MRALAALVFAVATASASASAEATTPALQVVAQSRDMIWNAVAVRAGRIYVAGPHWTGSRGPSLGVLDASGQVHAYPDAAWNSTDPQIPPGQRLVNVNAIHFDPDGHLWVVDTGVTGFGGKVQAGAAKLLCIDVAQNRLLRVVPLGPEAATADSYIDDIRFHGGHAYLTDAGAPALLVLDLASGHSRRVLADHVSTRASGRPIVVAGKTVATADGKPLQVNVDPLELSPDGQWLYYGSLEGPWSRIETHWLDDSSLSEMQLQSHVEPWHDLPPVGGTAMAGNGDFYFTDLAHNGLRRISADGTTQTVLIDARLHWVDAPSFDEQGRLYLPVPQLDRAAMFHHGQAQFQWPIELYRLDLPTR